MKQKDNSPLAPLPDLPRPLAGQNKATGSPSAGGVDPLADDAFSAVFESSGEALAVIDASGVIARANRAARELLRLDDASFEPDLLGGHWPHLPADDVSQLRTLAAGGASQRGFRSTLPGGSPVRIALRAVLAGREKLLVCLEANRAAQLAEAETDQAEAELVGVLDSIQAGVILFSASGRVRFANARLSQLFSVDPRELAGAKDFETLQSVLAPRFRDPEAFAAPWKSFLAGHTEPRWDELEIALPNRRVFERLSRPVLDSEGRAIGWLELYTDVTGQRHIQSKMLQTEKMAAVGQLVSGIAHELNNPLTSILGYTQLLLGRGLAAGPLSEARRVYQEAERARRIVKNLLYFARESDPERVRVDLNEIVERTLALRSYELKIENIAVDLDLAADLPRTLADPYQLQQVVLNLVINAEQALLEGRGKGRIEIRTRRLKRGAITLEVSDDGPGIPPEIAWRVFDPFFTTKPVGVGTGLGLSIVYGIVQQHGGEVTFENPAGGGAKFVVELPAAPSQARAQAPALPPLLETARAVAAARILVVEDEPTVAQLIADVLRDEGHDVEVVLDSQDGLTRLARGHFDLVVCDLRMPRLDGPAFYDALVRAGSPVRNRIIFVTGDTLAPRTNQFLIRHNLPHLAKPFLVEELKLAVSHALGRRQRDAKAG